MVLTAKQIVIQGQQAGSLAEVTVAQALDYYQLEYYYQYPVYGVTQIVGSNVIDFLVFTKPKPTPLEVQSLFWHGSPTEKSRDALKYALMEHMMGSNYMPMKEIWDEDWATLDKAKIWVKDNLI